AGAKDPYLDDLPVLVGIVFGLVFGGFTRYLGDLDDINLVDGMQMKITGQNVYVRKMSILESSFYNSLHFLARNFAIPAATRTVGVIRYDNCDAHKMLIGFLAFVWKFVL